MQNNDSEYFHVSINDRRVCQLVLNADLFCFQRRLCSKSQRNIMILEPFLVQKRVSDEFDRYFRGNKHKFKITDEEYLDRILQVPELCGEILELAGFLFHKILLKPDVYTNFKDSGYTIKLFATCLYFVQKWHLDQEFCNEDICKVLGLEINSISYKELFLYTQILKFEFKIDEESLGEFKDFLQIIPKTIENLKLSQKLAFY